MVVKYKDVASFQDRIKQMNITAYNSKTKRMTTIPVLMTKERLTHFTDRQKSIGEVFEDLDFAPNNNQYAVAAVAAS